ncbi:MAG: FAD-binding oxidoreductase [Pseudomonadaceae bacterium]|nr:FAD-binding oxidoreductase [Pseudomonadaceae bacterium]
MTQGTDYDIAIIGAGAAGLSVAYFLSEDARVVVLEAESQPAYHSSGRSAAMYIEGYENQVVRHLTQSGKNFFFAPPAEFSDTPLVTQAGGLTVSGPAEAPKLERYLNTWQPHCPELQPISVTQARDIIPILRTTWLSAAAYDPSWHNIDVHALLQGYQRGIRQNGGEVITDFRTDNIERAGKHWHMRCADRQVSAPILINAAGAWANHIAELARIDTLPLTPLRRTAAIVPAPANCRDWPLLHTISENLYFKPESPGLMVCPQDETPSPAMDAYAHEIDIAQALDTFAQVADFDVKTVTHSWAGLRTFTPDRFPVVGFDKQNNGFFWLAGQGGFGIQTSPGLARLAADLVKHESPQDEVNIVQQISVNRF